jgi:hypothetical protein
MHFSDVINTDPHRNFKSDVLHTIMTSSTKCHTNPRDTSRDTMFYNFFQQLSYETVSKIYENVL